MSAALPEKVDAARAVATRREYSGSVPLKSLPRLCGALAASDGSLAYRIGFDRDALGISFLALEIEGDLPLICQRTLEPFGWPLHLVQRLGLVRSEHEEAGLTEDYEALLLEDGEVDLADVIQDEALLAIPLIPLSPGSESQAEWIDPGQPDEDEVVSPFAALASLKQKQNRKAGE